MSKVRELSRFAVVFTALIVAPISYGADSCSIPRLRHYLMVISSI